ncbi:MAG: flagellar hook-associated protein FlgK [Pseudobdellovibrionaceae bacterium]
MAKINAMMDMGKRSMANSQTALQTVGHNIANKSTEGFSRQRVEQVSAVPIGEGRIQIGMGSRASGVTRVNNPWLEKQIQREQSSMGYMNSRAEALGRVEQVYNEQMNKGLNQYMTDFFNGFRELSNSPESLATRTMVRENANAMTKDFGRVVNQLQDVQKDLDGQLITSTQEVNIMIKEIAALNEKIQLVEVQGTPANDQRDRRDLLLKKLGEKIDISWAESASDGMVSVSAGGSGILVSGTSVAQLQAKSSDDGTRIDIYYYEKSNSSPTNITERIKGGQMGGALQVRDHVVEDLLKNVDQLAYSLAKEVNKAHIEGFDNNGRSGILFFEMPEAVKGAAQNLSVNKTIFDDVSRIAAASKPDAPGDNTVANVISALQYKNTMMSEKATFDDFYNTQVGQIGTITQGAMKSQSSQENILNQLGQIRESISGVSLDEEATKMIEFQKTYDASARLIKTADEMFDTILNLKRL